MKTAAPLMIALARFLRRFGAMRASLLVTAATLFLSASARLVFADINRSQPPPAGSLPAASFPDYRESTLANGLKVFVVEDHRQPTVTFRLLIKAGDACDGPKPGTADATAALLNKGTARRDAATFAKEVDFLGASVEAGAGEDATSVAARGLVKFMPQVLDLFTDTVLHPVFPEAELAKEKARSLSRLAQAKQQPGWLLGSLRGKLLYGSEHPYGAYPTEQSISAITRDDLLAWHHAWFLPNNATLAIVGDIKAEAVLPLVEKAFAEWKKGDVPTIKFPPLPEPARERTIHLVDRPSSVQSAIAVAAPGVPRNNPDLSEIGVVNSVLGGGFSGRLFQNLRERHGYTYGSNSGFSAAKLGGIFSASAEVRNDVTLPALQEILHEIERLRAEPVPDPELSMQRSYLAGNFLLSLESPARMAERVQEIDLYGLPGDYYKTYARRVESVNTERAEALAKKYLPDENAVTIVVVGEAKDVQPQLEKLGKVIVYDLDLKAKP
jgi:predicted Zn-dependent peptidase